MQGFLTPAIALLTVAFVNHATAEPKPVPKVIRFEADTMSAYKKALQVNKPLVIVFVCPLSDHRCVHCKRLRGVIFGEQFQVLADRAVFVIAEIQIRNGQTSKDEAARVIFNRLELKVTPTISVLAPDAKRIHELVRIKGYHPAEKLIGHVERGLKQVPAQTGSSKR